MKQLSDDIFEHTPKLSWIKLAGNRLEHIGQSLYRLPKANRIELDKCSDRIEDIDLVGFAKMPKLERLSLARTGFTFELTKVDVDGHEWNSSLNYLDIESNNLTDANELSKLRIFPHLEVLNLGGNLFSDLNIEGNETLKDVLPSLKLIYIRQSVNINCDRIAIIAQQWKSNDIDSINDC